jgi:hypothetical protein
MEETLNLMSWNCKGVMSAVPYLSSCIEKFSIHICAFGTFHLRGLALQLSGKKSFICAAKYLSFAQIFYLRFTCCNPSIAQITCNFFYNDYGIFGNIYIIYIIIIPLPKQSSTSLGSRKASPKNDLNHFPMFDSLSLYSVESPVF